MRPTLLTIAAAAFLCAGSAHADPQLSFSPYVYMQFTPSIEEAANFSVTSDVVHGSSSFSSTGDGAASASWSADAFSISGDASASAVHNGMGKASIDVLAHTVITNLSGEDRTFSVDYGYAINGYVSTASGFTSENWTVGILDSDLPLSGFAAETQSHQCPPGTFYDCFNFYDYNYYIDAVTLAAGQSYFFDMGIKLNLVASAPEAPTILILCGGLFFLCAFTTARRVPRSTLATMLQ